MGEQEKHSCRRGISAVLARFSRLLEIYCVQNRLLPVSIYLVDGSLVIAGILHYLVIVSDKRSSINSCLRLPWYLWPIVGCERGCEGGA